jgi:DNA-binding response OmpR family regulator
MLVPKMVKNGFNFAFRFQNGLLLQRKYGLRPSSKLNLNHERRIKTVFNHFRNTHARADAYILKPIDFSNLDQTMKECLRKQQPTLEAMNERLTEFMTNSNERQFTSQDEH